MKYLKDGINMADITTVGLLVGTSALINVTYAVQHKKPVATVLVGNGLSFAALAVFGSISGRMDVAAAFAGLFLVSALLFHGTKIDLGISALAGKK
jgi:hypothetical protein